MLDWFFLFDFQKAIDKIRSKNYKNWIATLDLKTCFECSSNHGKIYQITEDVVPQPPLHFHCRCVIIPMKSIEAGNATKNEDNGADINYYEGKRNKHRILWSNDGLMFVTYDHYETFYEII